MMRRPSVLSTVFFLGLAALCHFLIFVVTPVWISTSDSPSENKWVELWNRDGKRNSNLSIVQTEEAKNKIKSSQAARFGGRLDQRVEKETRAPLVGRFYQARPRPTVPDPSEEFTLSDLMGLGSTPNVLPDDIETGSHTVLNTDKVLYAGYFSRVADEVYQPWVNRVEVFFRQLTERQRKIEANYYVTRLRLTLDNEGGVHIIQIIKSSGIDGLDEASKQAIWDREPFPHPPDQLVDEDGWVRLNYEFQVELKDSGFNILPWKT